MDFAFGAPIGSTSISSIPLCSVCNHHHEQGVKCDICGHVGKSTIYPKMRERGKIARFVDIKNVQNHPPMEVTC